jgi:hypothetical protein
MIRNKVLVAGAVLGALAALAIVAEPALAGTCVAVTVKGRGPDPATATTKAAVKLTQRAASLRCKVKKSSTSCQKGPPGASCARPLRSSVHDAQIAAIGGR